MHDIGAMILGFLALNVVSGVFAYLIGYQGGKAAVYREDRERIEGKRR